MKTYRLDEKQVDPLCSNKSRACYLGYDPQAYLMTELIELVGQSSRLFTKWLGRRGWPERDGAQVSLKPSLPST